MLKKVTEKVKGLGKNKVLNTRVQELRQASNDLKEVAKKRYKVHNLEKKMNDNFNKMGGLLYKQKQGDKGVQAEIDKLFEEVKDIEAEIKACEEQINEMQSEPSVCPKCKEVLPKVANYCSHCGYDVVKQKKRKLSIFNFLRRKKKNKDLNLCPKCGEAFPENGVYCNYCGYKVDKGKKGRFRFLNLFRRKKNNKK